MSDTNTADYRQIADAATDDIVVIDRGGFVTRFGTASAYEVFQAGLSALHQSLFDETTGRWIVGAAKED